MHAIEVTETGGPEVLKYVDKPAPSPGPGEVSIKAEAIGVNFVDTYFRSGSYPHELPFVLGAEVGGTVEALGDGVTALRVGERVATADAVGAYAEYCFAPANVVASVPAGVSTDVAAAAILKGMTAHLLIKSVFPVQDGDTVLVHAGAGGVGLILTQWATSLGAHVISTASSPEKAELSRKAGAVYVLSYPGRRIRREDPRTHRRQGGRGRLRRGRQVDIRRQPRQPRQPGDPGHAGAVRCCQRTCPSFRSPTAQCRRFGLSHPAFTPEFHAYAR
jgi:NADPH:quinone reductase-like Zn-dependent oxidoreductase